MRVMKYLFCAWVVLSFIPPYGKLDAPMRYIATVGIVLVCLTEIRNAIEARPATK